jgi:hypothetical protein
MLIWIKEHKWRASAVIVGLVVLVAVVVYFLFFSDSLQGDWVTRIIAVVGFAVTAGKVAYDIWDKERDRKKKADEKKEKVRTFALCKRQQGGFNLSVDIYNDGAAKIHIRNVYLAFTENGFKNQYQLVADPPRPAVTSVTFSPSAHLRTFTSIPKLTSWELDTKGKVLFYLNTSQHLPAPGVCPDLRIVIESYQGEVAVVPESEWNKDGL